jgi:glycosyltransferase involved in cell wall biosynthesis
MTNLIKVLLVCDQRNWILGKIARQLSNRLDGAFDITFIARSDDAFLAKLRSLQNRVDLVHFLSPGEYLKCRAFTYLPCVVTLWHMVDWKYFDPYIARIDTLCVGSNQWQERVQTRISSALPIVRMPYGLDTREFSRRPGSRNSYLAKENLPGNTLVFGVAGAIKDRKGLDRLFNSFRLLIGILNIPVVLRVIGVGWKPEMIPTDLLPNVRLEYYISEFDLPQYYSSLDFYLCLSQIEGVPYPVIEAMSCQSLVISTPVGVVPEIIQDGKNGFILDEKNLSDDLIRIVKQTAGNVDFRFKCGELAREVIVDRFTWENVVDITAFNEIYGNAISHFNQRAILDKMMIRFIAMRDWLNIGVRNFIAMHH